MFGATLLFAASGAFAATYFSRATANWAVATTWSTAACGGTAAAAYPVAGDTVTICSPHTVTVAAAAAAATLTINSGATLTQSFGLTVTGGTLNVAGTLNSFNTLDIRVPTTITGTLDIRSATGGKTFRDTVTISVGGTFKNNTVVEAVTMRTSLTNNGTFTSGTGTYTFTNTGGEWAGSNGLTFAGGVTVSIGWTNNTTMSVAGTLAVSGVVTVTNNATVTASGALTGSVAGSTWTNAANSTLNVAGALLATAGTILNASASGNTVNYNGAGAQTVKLPSGGNYFHLSLSGGNTKTPAAGTYNVLGNLTLAAGVTYAGNTNNPVVNLAGNFSNSGTFNSGSGTFTFNGTGAQTLTGATTFTNLTMNNGGTGLTINNNVTVSTLLTLTSGVVSTGSNTLITTANCPGSVSRTGGHVAGFLRLQIPTGSPTCTFDVGDSTTYRPVNLTFSSVTAAGNLTGSVSQSAGDHPNISTSGLDDTQSVNRYWTLTNSGVTLTSYDATFNFVAGDVDGGADPLEFEVERWSGAAWNTTTVGTRTSTSTQATGITAFSDYASGKKKGGAAPTSFNAFETSTTAGAINGDIKTKIAGTAFGLDVVAIAAGVQLAAFTDQVIVELLGNNTLGISLDANNCPTSSTTVQTVSPNPTITGGRSTVSFAAVPNSWRDVRVRVRWPTSSPAVTRCSANNFAIRPSSITVSVTDATWTTAGNTRTLNNTAVSGGTVHKAGQPFRITAVAQPGTVTQYAGSPTAKTETCLTLSGMTGCTNGTATLPSGGWSGSGTRVNDSVTYSEVGALSFELEDQDFASVDAPDSTTAERYIPQTGGSIQAGRFVPDRFVVGAPNSPQFQTFGAACAGARSFSYVGQSFGYVTPPAAMVTAQNAAGGTTANYRESLWKITTGAPSDVTQNYSNNSVGPGLDTTQANNAPTVTPLNDGTATVTVNTLDRISYQRTTPIVPFNANISLTITVRDDSETDGEITTTSAAPWNAIAFDSGNEFRFGRLVSVNSVGSQLVPLYLRMELQYWNGTAFVTNAVDDCTTLAANNIEMSAFTQNLGACETSVTVGAFNDGRATAQLSLPGGSNAGSVTLITRLEQSVSGAPQTCIAGVLTPVVGANKSYLEGKWDSTDEGADGVLYDDNPEARATFGTYRGAEEVIFIRENF